MATINVQNLFLEIEGMGFLGDDRCPGATQGDSPLGGHRAKETPYFL